MNKKAQQTKKQTTKVLSLKKRMITNFGSSSSNLQNISETIIHTIGV